MRFIIAVRLEIEAEDMDHAERLTDSSVAPDLRRTDFVRAVHVDDLRPIGDKQS